MLFNFPSRYLFAIGLPPVFSLRWDLPPIRAAFSSYPTRLKQTCTRMPVSRMDGTFTLHGRHFHATFLNGHLQSAQNTTPVRDFHIGLLPLRSPLLGESWLVSFPGLSYMLKFSPSSCLIWDPKKQSCFAKKQELLPKTRNRISCFPYCHTTPLLHEKIKLSPTKQKSRLLLHDWMRRFSENYSKKWKKLITVVRTSKGTRK